MSVEWQARDVVTWLATVAAKLGAVSQLMFQSGPTPWYKVLEPNAATANGVKVVCTFPVRVKGAQGKKRVEFMFGAGKGLPCLVLGKGCTDLGCTRCTMRRVGVACGVVCKGLQGVGEDDFPESVMKACAAWVKDRKDN